MQNLIYWRGIPVGYECAGRVIFYPSAPADAIKELR